MPVRHRTPLSDLDALAVGRIAPATAQRIRAVERSRRMLMLRAVVETARGKQTAPLSPCATALGLLVRAEQTRPDVVADLLDHPGVGVWAVRMLQAEGPSSWRELGYLHALAASAAVRAAVTGTIDVPVIGGGVPLPGLGRVVLPADEDSAPPDADIAVLEIGEGRTTVAVTGQHVVLPADLSSPTDVWEPLHRITVDTAAPERDLVLDTSDPYRDYRTAPQESPSRLPQDELRGWELTLRRADELLVRRHADAAALRAAALHVIVPLPAAPRFRPASATYNEAFGSALLSPLPDAVELAATLVHEARHSVLNALLHQLPLCEDPVPGVDQPLFYAPWRGDPRPPGGTLHGLFSFAGVADFYRVERHALTGSAADLAHFEFALWRETVSEALEALAARQDLLTPLGRRFVGAMAEHMAPWAQESVPPAPLALARGEAADLRAVWRARHTRPDADGIRTLTEAWLRGADPTTLPAVDCALRPDLRFGPPDPRGELRRTLLEGPDALLAHARSESYTATRDPELAAADLALFGGDPGRAVGAYQDVLGERPDSPSAWAGLGLACAASGRHTAGDALLGRPEIVRALHLALTDREASPGPVALGDWVGRMPLPGVVIPAPAQPF